MGRGHPLLGLWVSTTGGPTWTSCDRCGNTRPSAWLAASDRSIRADPHAVISAGTARARVASDLAGLAHGGLGWLTSVSSTPSRRFEGYAQGDPVGGSGEPGCLRWVPRPVPTYEYEGAVGCQGPWLPMLGPPSCGRGGGVSRLRGDPRLSSPGPHLSLWSAGWAELRGS